jgi:hypothetical protein
LSGGGDINNTGVDNAVNPLSKTLSPFPDTVPVLPRLYRHGINSRDGLNILHDGGWIDIDEENTPDPTPIVEIGLERSWLSHSVWLYPGEYAIYTHVSYAALNKGWDLRFDRSGELGERPWQESEMTTEEITGIDDGSDSPRHKRMWVQISSVYPYTASNVPSLDTTITTTTTLLIDQIQL